MFRHRPTSPSDKRLPSRRRRLFVAVLIYAVLLLLIFTGVSDRLILFPTTEPLGTTGLDRHVIALPQGGTVEMWAARSRGAVGLGTAPKAYVLAFIGNAARAERTALFFAHDWGDRPVEVWAVNYPGFGASSGSARLKSIPPAALAAYDALRLHAGDKPIFVEARSIGTAPALYVAANRPVAGCILHNPPPLRELILGRHGWWNLWLLGGPVALSVPSELDSLANGRLVNAPAVFLLAGADEVVPPKYQKFVVDAYAGENKLVNLPAAAHTDGATGDALTQYEAAMDWIWSRTLREVGAR